MRKLGLSLLVSACAGSASAWAEDPAARFFDKPLKVEHVALLRDKDNPQAKPEVRCSYYSHFMVKEIDLGEIGAFQLSILPAKDAGPACRKDNAAGEKIVSPDAWTGYFKGVVGDYIFFDAEDGWNDGTGFAVFTPDAKKLFEDVAKSWSGISFVAPPGPAGMPPGHALALHYVRVYGAKCSLAGAKAHACWQTIERDTGLQGAAPDCMALYAREQKRTPKFAKEVLEDPTVIDYDAATTLAFNGTRVAAATRRPIRCRPAE